MAKTYETSTDKGNSKEYAKLANNLNNFMYVMMDEFSSGKKKKAFPTKMVNEFNKIFYKEVRKNASLTDHSLSDLKQMGHPYAKSKSLTGTKQWTKKQKDRPATEGLYREGKRRGTLGHTKWFVHKQSGTLYENIVIIPPKSVKHGITESFVGVMKQAVPYIDDIIYGTEKMVARDFFQKSMPEAEKKANKEVTKGINAVFEQVSKKISKRTRKSWA